MNTTMVVLTPNGAKEWKYFLEDWLGLGGRAGGRFDGQWRLSIRTSGSSTGSPEPQMPKRRVALEPGSTGAVGLAQGLCRFTT